MYFNLRAEVDWYDLGIQIGEQGNQYDIAEVLEAFFVALGEREGDESVQAAVKTVKDIVLRYGAELKTEISLETLNTSEKVEKQLKEF